MPAPVSAGSDDAGKTSAATTFYLEVISQPEITPEGKAQADSIAQQPRQDVSISSGLQRRHRGSDGVIKLLLISPLRILLSIPSGAMISTGPLVWMGCG